MRAPKMLFESNRIGGVFETLLKQTGNPTDFELLIWCNYNKDKPSPYAFIRHNVYLTKKIKKRLEEDGIFCACRPPPGSSGVCGKDCHCGFVKADCLSLARFGVGCPAAVVVEDAAIQLFLRLQMWRLLPQQTTSESTYEEDETCGVEGPSFKVPLRDGGLMSSNASAHSIAAA